ncbi:hypothetical protein ATEIFO6365_0004073700 [Aspergillus terreus]|uniref:Uncharacterized protein n=1 Tax=Aspergillus terreus TaxID=33178 RepID=A0A5M3YSA4_ASPTE|nr:hypothetical protein ATETN484_0002076200 [Aspergillus terreus]GFF15618.1 hypothetical protein ATEIFO6365_0004073700 [Aspergillus terreus]
MRPSAKLALTELYPPSAFTGFEGLQKVVKSNIGRLDKGGEDQYISLKHLGAKVLFTYFPDIETLIIKVPARQHERAHRLLDQLVASKLTSMNVGFLEFMPDGSATYTGPTQSQKEGDSVRTNTQLRPQGGWPHFVIEAGVSESMPRLRADAAWWFSNSSGDVKLVLLIKVDTQRRVITIEKHDRYQSRPTWTKPSPWIAHRLRTITLNQGVTPATCDVKVPSGRATGPPLTLEFDLVVGRAANPPLEKDIEFTAAELLNWSAIVFQ